MSTHTATRIGAGSGVAYVVGVLAANSAGTDTAAISFGLLALVLFVPFLASLWSVLCAYDGPGGWLPATVLAAGVLAVAVKLVSVLPEVVLLQGGLGSAQRDVLQRLADAAYIVTMLPLGVCLAAVAASVLATRALPGWLGWSAAVTAVLLVANSLDLASDFGPAFLLFLLWVLATAIVLLRRAMTVPAPVGARSARPLASS
jgi:hypothetical protein